MISRETLIALVCMSACARALASFGTYAFSLLEGVAQGYSRAIGCEFPRCIEVMVSEAQGCRVLLLLLLLLLLLSWPLGRTIVS